jgi:hypothetical protein
MPSLRDISGQFGPWSSPVYVVVGNSCDTTVQHIHARLWIVARNKQTKRPVVVQ